MVAWSFCAPNRGLTKPVSAVSLGCERGAFQGTFGALKEYLIDTYKMHLNVHTYLHMHLHTYVNIRVMYMYIPMYITVYTCMYTYVYIYINAFIYMKVYIYTFMHMCTCTCKCSCTCICIYVYIYIYTCTCNVSVCVHPSCCLSTPNLPGWCCLYVFMVESAPLANRLLVHFKLWFGCYRPCRRAWPSSFGESVLCIKLRARGLATAPAVAGRFQTRCRVQAFAASISQRVQILDC